MASPGGLTLRLTDASVVLVRNCRSARRCRSARGRSGVCDFIGAWPEVPSLSCPSARPARALPSAHVGRAALTSMAARDIAVVGGIDTHTDLHQAAVARRSRSDWAASERRTFREPCSTHIQATVPERRPVVLGISQTPEMGVLDACLGQRQSEAGLAEAGLAADGREPYIGHDINTAVDERGDERGDVATFVPADHSPGATFVSRNRSSRETPRASASEPTVKKPGWLAPPPSNRARVPTVTSASSASSSRVHPRASRNARSWRARARVWS